MGFFFLISKAPVIGIFSLFQRFFVLVIRRERERKKGEKKESYKAIKILPQNIKTVLLNIFYIIDSNYIFLNWGCRILKATCLRKTRSSCRSINLSPTWSTMSCTFDELHRNYFRPHRPDIWPKHDSHPVA